MSSSKRLYPLLSTGLTQEDRKSFRHEWKIVDWNIKQSRMHKNLLLNAHADVSSRLRSLNTSESSATYFACAIREVSDESVQLIRLTRGFIARDKSYLL